MNKFLYKKIYWLYFLIANFRMAYYILTRQKQKSIKIITEGFDW
jgi:hypothetical protein